MATAIQDIIDYVENSQKTDGGRMIPFLRCDSLGEEYDISVLWAILAGKRAHTTQTKNVHVADPPKVNLLVDIQTKLRDGKGADMPGGSAFST